MMASSISARMPLRVWREIPNLHVLDHALAKWRHWQPSFRVKRATVRSAMLPRSKPPEVDAMPGPFSSGRGHSAYISVSQ
jgi:hypothetical protein